MRSRCSEVWNLVRLSYAERVAWSGLLPRAALGQWTSTPSMIIAGTETGELLSLDVGLRNSLSACEVVHKVGAEDDLDEELAHHKPVLL